MDVRVGQAVALPLVAGLLAGVSAWAQGAPEPGPPDALAQLLQTPIEVSATRPGTVFVTPSTVTVLLPSRLARYGIRTLAQAVELVSGMSIQRSIFHTDMPTSRGILQEGYANRVLLLINGVPTWNVLTGDGFLARIALDDIERIEVLKGPASVLYGTNAFAGAINVILRRPSAEETALTTGLLEQGGHDLGLRHSRREGTVSLFASVHSDKVIGEVAEVPGEGGSIVHLHEFRERRSANLVLKAGDHDLLINGFNTTAPLLGATFSAASGGGRDLVNRGLLGAYAFHHAFRRGLELRYTFAWDQSQRVFSGDQAGARVYLQSGLRFGHTLSANWQASPQLGLELGAADETRRNHHYTLVNPLSGVDLLQVVPRGLEARESSGFVQAHWRVGPWGLLGGTRYTRSADFGSNLSSRATLLYQVGPKESLKLIWGQSFRAPAMLEQYMAIPGVAFGNRDLQPETSDSVEVAYLKAFDRFFIQALVYQSTFAHKLFRVRRYPVYSGDPTDPSVIYVNGQAFRARGLELELRYDHPGLFNAFLNLDYSRGDRGDEYPGSRGYNFKFVPALNAKLGISRSWHALSASAICLRQDAARGPFGPIPGWTSVDLHLGWRQELPWAGLNHALTLRNLGGKERYFAEYTRRNVNQVPEGLSHNAAYTLTLTF